eukprot:TRINITY_DN3286_c0_g1_i2.p1 TRINITY_DN3286_c0_g1~~TRINITY_DN3286_c0_g1_i2.p1  ORF type:complete len:201 (+),score=35.33 TRINITY_DN3286_c0_g1_i2:187-789(+)
MCIRDRDSIMHEIRDIQACNKVSYSQIGSKVHRALKEAENDICYKPVVDKTILKVNIDLRQYQPSKLEIQDADVDKCLIETEARKIGNQYFQSKIKSPEFIKANKDNGDILNWKQNQYNSVLNFVSPRGLKKFQSRNETHFQLNSEQKEQITSPKKIIDQLRTSDQNFFIRKNVENELKASKSVKNISQLISSANILTWK